MRTGTMAVVLVVAAAAGCLGGDDGEVVEDAPALVVVLESYGLPDVQPARSAVPPERPLVATVMWHEDGDDSPPEALGLDIEILNEREARDVPLTFHGLHETFDEWGRPILAHVFRYAPMLLVPTSSEFGPAGLSIEAEWQAVPMEFLFDAADGRFLGSVWLDDDLRVFVDPHFRDPMAWTGAAAPLLLMFLQVVGDDLTLPVDAYIGAYRLVPHEGSRPLPGDCAMHRLEFELYEPPAEAEPEDGGITIVCVEEGSVVPLWVWQGADGAGQWWQHTGGDLLLPGFIDDPLPPHEWPRHAWTATPHPTGLLGPILVPRVSEEGDWAGRVQARLEALILNPHFALYHAQHGGPVFPAEGPLYVDTAFTGLPVMEESVLEQLGGPSPIDTDFDEESWVMVTQGEDQYWGFVHTQNGDVETADRHVSWRQGAEFQSSSSPAPAELPDGVAVNEVVAALSQLAPPDPRSISFIVWPEFADYPYPELWEPNRLRWSGVEVCHEPGFRPAEGDESLIAILSGVTGQLVAAGYGAMEFDACASDMAMPLRMPDGDWAWAVPVPLGAAAYGAGRGVVVLPAQLAAP